MKIINKKYKFILFALTVITGLGIWSCSDDEDADRISLASQILPKVTSISPNSGILGTEVTITGENFSDQIDEIAIGFVGENSRVPAAVTAASKTSITVTVPSGAITGELSVVIGRSKVQGGPLFTILPPEGISYNVSSGLFGTPVTISGTNFSPELSDNGISFNGVEAEVIDATATSLTTIVPFGATTGEVTITVDGNEGSGPVFTVPEPTITSIDVTTGDPGTVITIIGTNFSTTLEDNIVSFNGTIAEVTAVTETSIVTSVPTGATTGAITVSIGGQEATGPEFEVTGAITLVIPLTSNDDDVEEIDIPSGSRAQGDMDLGSSDLELGELSSGQGIMKIGLRFNNVTIPQGTTVSEAYVQFRCDDDGADPVELTIYGEDVADAAPFADELFNLSLREITSESIVWSVPPWENPGDRGPAQRTVNIASIIQEIVNRDDWVSGNSINIIMRASGVSLGATSSSGGREAENYSSSTPEDGAELTVIF